DDKNILERSDDWRGFRVKGVLDFSLVGILAKISGLLAENDIALFAVSTFNTDYIFVKSDKFTDALNLLNNV
ncbi:MAG: ACT domain-containing protein, partial [Synergistaceae bacterium]|nr:ACT domain-containing protein [Synergistaceae bacterium]